MSQEGRIVLMRAGDQETSQIVPFEPAHVEGVAQVHSDCFPGFFLTQLGVDFLELYYNHYLKSSFGFGAVALGDDDSVEGFVLGVTNLDAHDSSFLKRHLLAITAIVSRRFLYDATVRQKVWERGRRFARIAMKMKMGERRPSGQVNLATDPYATLTSLAVRPALRGTGAATDLVDAFGAMVKSKGFPSMRAATALDNHRARAFYEKSGWVVQQVRESENGVTYERFV